MENLILQKRKMVQDRIQKSFEPEINKAIYADTPENRKLGRVGQEWERSKNKKASSVANAMRNEFIKHTVPINGNGDAFHPDVTEVLKQNWDNPDVKAVFKKYGFNSIKEAKEWSESGASSKNNPSYQQLRSHYKKGRMLLKEALQVIPGEKFLSQKEKLDEYEKNDNRFNQKSVIGEKEKKQFIKQASAGTIDAKYTDRIISANADEPGVKKVLKKYGLNNINDFFEWDNYDLYDEAYMKMLRAIPAEKFIKKAQDTEIEKAYSVGQSHPKHPDWLWTDLGNGKFDWKSKNGKWWKGKTGNAATPAPASKPAAQKKFDADVIEHVDELVKKIGKDKALERFERYVKEYGDDGTKFGAMMKYKYSQAAEYLKGKAESDFKKTFKDARDEVLQQVVSGKIQASADEKKWAKDLLDERKAATTVPTKIDYSIDKKIYDNTKHVLEVYTIDTLEKRVKSLTDDVKACEQNIKNAKTIDDFKFHQENLTADISRKKAAEDVLAEKKAKSQNITSTDIKDAISGIPAMERLKINGIIRKNDVNSATAIRCLRKSNLSDDGLRNFLLVAEYFANSKEANDVTRSTCKKWAELAKKEMQNRDAEKKDSNGSDEIFDKLSEAFWNKKTKLEDFKSMVDKSLGSGSFDSIWKEVNSRQHSSSKETDNDFLSTLQNRIHASSANVGSKQDKAAQNAGFKDYKEMKAWQDYGTAKQLLKKELKRRGKPDKQKIADLKEEIATYEKNHADVIAAHSSDKNKDNSNVNPKQSSLGGKKAVDDGNNKTTQKSKPIAKTFAGKVIERATKATFSDKLSDDARKKLEDAIKNDKASINDLLRIKFPSATATPGFNTTGRDEVQLANGKILKLVHEASIYTDRIGQEYTKHRYEIKDEWGKLLGSYGSTRGYTTPSEAKQSAINQALYAIFCR